MCPGEGSGGAGGGGSQSPGEFGGGGDIGAILAYLNHYSFGTDGDYTGNAGYGGDNIGPVGSKEPEKDEARSSDLLDVLMAPPGGQVPGWPWRPGVPNEGSREIEPYGGAQAATGSLFPFAGMDVDVYSGLPLGNESPDPFTGLPASDPFAEDERPMRARSDAPWAAIRPTSLLSSPPLTAHPTAPAAGPIPAANRNTTPARSTVGDGHYVQDPTFESQLLNFAPADRRNETIDGTTATFVVYRIATADGGVLAVYKNDKALHGRGVYVMPEGQQASTPPPGVAPVLLPPSTQPPVGSIGDYRLDVGSVASPPQSSFALAPPLVAPRQFALGYAAPQARLAPLTATLRSLPGGTPRSFLPGASLWNQPYNLWSGGVDFPKTGPAAPTSITPGSGAQQAMRSPGYIMEDTTWETLAEQTATQSLYGNRFLVPFNKNPNSPFARTWGPTSDALAIEAGLSQSTVSSHGLDSHPAPQGTVQFNREIPRIQLAGGLVAQAGKMSGILTIINSSSLDNRYARYIGYGAGSLEFAAGSSYLIGSSGLGAPLGSGLLSASTMQGLQSFGRIGGGIGSGTAQAVLYGDKTVKAVEHGDDVGAYIYAGAAIGGVAIVVGAIVGAPVLVVGGAVWGLAALGYQFIQWIGE